MKFPAIILLCGLFSFAAFAQTAKPKPTPPKSTSPTKNTKKQPSAGKQTQTKAKPDDKKTKSTVSKSNTAPKSAKANSKASASTKKPLVKPPTKAALSKNNPAAPNPATNSQSLPEPDVNEDDASAEFEKAIAIAEAPERIAALKGFIKAYSTSNRVPDAQAMIVTVWSQLGNDRLTAGDAAAAFEYYEAAVKDAPEPVPDALFLDTLAKFAANLYFRGARAQGVEIARAIEEKSKATVSQLLSIATFYMSVENGSEARRIAERAIKLDRTSSPAYQTLGLANRIDFLLEESAAAYAQALQIEPESLTARRGLAEMKRSLGKSGEAVTLYREILAKDEADLPARTGLVLALFDSGNRSEAESEMARSLEANPGNVILLAGAAYWYAIQGEGDQAVGLAQKALAADPRFIWSHIALARGYLAQRNPTSAEKTLLAARRYGNFPTLEYEIASARVAGGFYREAAEELAKSFSVKNGVVSTKLGGRVLRSSKDFAALVGFERRASIFAPTPADGPDNSAQMAALLELKQELDQTTPNPEAVAKTANDFVNGEDTMKVHRLIYASSQLLNKNVALPTIIELTKAAPAFLDAGLDVADPSAAVMASELYESRTLAALRGEYIGAPFVPRQTLSGILRGRIEEINGWTNYQMEKPDQASIHLKRAVSVLPVDSAWWRSSTWRLGTSLLLEGKNNEALDMYVRSYKSQPGPLRYSAIESLYKRINGHTMGLEKQIGPNPNQPVSTEAVAQQRTQVTPPIPIALTVAEPTPEVAAAVLPKPESSPAQAEEPVPMRLTEDPKTILATAPSPTPTPTPEQIATSVSPDPTPKSEPTEAPKAVIEASPTPTPEPSPEPIPAATPESTPISTPESTPVATPEKPAPTPTPDGPPAPSKTPELVETQSIKLADNTNGLFPPVIIPIPRQENTRQPGNRVAEARPTASPTPGVAPSLISELPEDRATSTTRPRVVIDDPLEKAAIAPCKLTLSEENITLQGGGDLAVIVGRTDDGDLDGLTAVSGSPRDVYVRREAIAGVRSRALFVLRSANANPGEFQVTFTLPCGTRKATVVVR